VAVVATAVVSAAVPEAAIGGVHLQNPVVAGGLTGAGSVILYHLQGADARHSAGPSELVQPKNVAVS
jgi:hypothetical protein